MIPEVLIKIFSSDKILLKDAVPALKQYFVAFIFMNLQYMGQTVFKSLNKKKQEIFFSLLRKVFIVVPLTYIMPYLLHITLNILHKIFNKFFYGDRSVILLRK